MNDLTDKAIEAVREISLELRPAILDSLGLAAALEWLAEEFQHRTGIVTSCCIETDEFSDKKNSTPIFRIVQECLTNVVRHAKATTLEITVKCENDRCLLTVSDNGVGITAEQIADVRSLGLLGIKERATAIDGTIEIKGMKGNGTTVTLSVPLNRIKESVVENSAP